MLKVVVAFPTNDPQGYKVEYINGEDLKMKIDPETHDLTISGRGDVFMAVFCSWLWAKASQD